MQRLKRIGKSTLYEMMLVRQGYIKQTKRDYYFNEYALADYLKPVDYKTK